MTAGAFIPVPPRVPAMHRRARRAACLLASPVVAICRMRIGTGDDGAAQRRDAKQSGKQSPPRRALRGAKAGTRFSPYADYVDALSSAGGGGADDWSVSDDERGHGRGTWHSRQSRQREGENANRARHQKRTEGSQSDAEQRDGLRKQGQQQQKQKRRTPRLDDNKSVAPRNRNPVLSRLMYGTDMQVRSALEELATGNLPMNIHEFNDVLSTLGRQRKMRSALGLIRIAETSAFAKLIAPHRNVKTYTIILDIHGKAHQLAHAFTLFYGMQRDGVQPNVITYNALVNSCSRNNEPDLAFEVYLEMQKAGLKPDKFTYASLIDSRARRGEVDRAFAIADLMDRNGVAKDQTIYSALVDACGRVKQLDRALLVFEEMKRRAVWPNLITFAVLLDCCANTRQPYKAFEIFAEIKHWNLEPNVVTYTSLLDCCSKAGWPERAEMVLQHMRDNKVEPNEITYGALIDAWCRDGQLDRAFAAVESMAVKDGVAPNAILIGGLIEACRRLQDGTRIGHIWKLILDNDIRPARGYFPSLIALSAYSKDLDTSIGIAAYCYPRGILRRASCTSSDVVHRALAYAIVCLREVVRQLPNAGARASRSARLAPILAAMQLPDSMSVRDAFRETNITWEVGAPSRGLHYHAHGGDRQRDGPSPAARQAKDVAMLQLKTL
jgi:pentatricopeptide repeat protein